MAETSLVLRRAEATAIEYVEELLARADLPTADVRENPECFYVAERRDERVGVGGLEIHGDAGLLRSVAVEPAERGFGLGTAIVDALEAEAADAGVDELYLLTETAVEFFDRLGYVEIERADAPEPMQQTTEFAELCSDSAVCMQRVL